MMIGFSTGALAKGDFRAGLEMQRNHARGVVELSALREHELDALLAVGDDLDLEGFGYVSVHIPSKLVDLDEAALVDRLERFPSDWPLVVHPTVINDPALWGVLGSRVCIENMDGRKGRGRTVEELEPWMHLMPRARFCLDVAHAAGVDSSMREALGMLDSFGARLSQLHVSRLGTSYEHLPLDDLMIARIRRIAPLVPKTIPLVIESVVEEDQVAAEIHRVAEAFGR